MIRLLHKLPRKLTVAFSGGVDSVAALDFLSNNHEVDAAFFHHGTETSDNAHDFVRDFCKNRGIKLTIGHVQSEKPKELSWEEHWRNQRYKFLENFEHVVTAHHLNDCIETYVWSAMHGEAKIIPEKRKNVYRPFLLNTKIELINWCENKKLPWIEDKTNHDDKYMRNYIRKHVVEHAYHINPGIEKVIRKLILNASVSEQE